MSDPQSKPRRFPRVSRKTQRRVIDGATVLLDIAKESADVLPALKSCLGGIDAFRKHYQESKDVDEKINDLLPWLAMLEKTVVKTSLDVNSEESARREQFNRSLEDIWKRAEKLSGKDTILRFVDKVQDSSVITKLAEELRQATLIYQLSQQQSIENQVSQLASSLNGFLELYEKTSGVKEKIQSTLLRLGRLEVAGGAVGEGEEPKYRRILFDTLEGIKDQLQSLSERSCKAGYRENREDMQVVCGLVEDVRDAVIEYQIHQQNALCDRSRESIVHTEWLVLNTCPRASKAAYSHGNRNGCLKGTRESVLDKAEQWIEDSNQSPVFWLRGLAGTGKTTIAQTIAGRLFADGRLGASFFCFRGSNDQSDPQLIFPTLAFQLAERYPEFRSSLIRLLPSNPDVARKSLEVQMKKFLIEPLQSADISTVIVIDALDECKDRDLDPDILTVLGKSIQNIPKVKLFITSRPETHIVDGFRDLLREQTDVFVLHQVEPDTINQDIYHFFDCKLSELAERRGGKEGWPTDEQLDWLCERAAGFFVHAVATVNVLNHHIKAPWNQLDIIMKSPESTAREGGVKLKGGSGLDDLYLSILHASFHDNTDEDNVTVRSVLSWVVLATDPLSPTTIATLTNIEWYEVQRVLELIRSLLVLDESDQNKPVRSFHKSFPDFMTDQNRCTDPRFYISPDYHVELFKCCLQIINKSPENVPSLPKPGVIHRVAHLPKIEATRICGALRYACGSWHEHLVVTKDPTIHVLSALLVLLEQNFVFWLAVLEALGDLPRACQVMDATIQWLKKAGLPANANDLRDIAVRHSDLVGRLTVTRNLYDLSRMF